MKTGIYTNAFREYPFEVAAKKIRDAGIDMIELGCGDRYMWYPGQLAAFYQQQCARTSKERCVNVGYPGKFFAKASAFIRFCVLASSGACTDTMSEVVSNVSKSTLS